MPAPDLKSPFFQLVRVADVVFVGPLLIFAGTLTKNPILRAAFVATGIATIVFNGLNFVELLRGDGNRS